MDIHQILARYWGHTSFRPLQQDIIEHVIGGGDALALLPTGGGKSVCFQIPAMAKPGICIVVSPLIALMKDQVENLRSKGINAIAIVSGMGKREVDIALDNCIYGDVKFLYLSPERLLSDLVRLRISYMRVNLIAVDEAHCISQWGYDFRPPYLEIAKLREILPDTPVIALTATATSRVVEDIQSRLKLKSQVIFRKSFERRNLCYLVYNEENKLGKLLKIINKTPGSGIVYVRNRRETQETARLLSLEGISADYYHAGLTTAVRATKQDQWKKSQTRVIVATNAFGMGIDKPDVRFVVHLDLPESLEAYYQEAGRGGRDGKRSYAVLLHNNADKHRLLRNLEQYPSVDEVRSIYHALGNFYQLAFGAGRGLTLEFDLADFCNRFKLEPLKTIQALKFLEHDGYIALSESVYLPSRIQILYDPDALYRLQVQQPGFDGFIKVLLRSYGGLYDQFVPIRESDIARRAGMPRAEVLDKLRKLQSMEVLTYIPQTDKPHITFVRERVDSQNFDIDSRYMRERYEIHSVQVQAVLSYVSEHTCRSQQLLTYFDEESHQSCGLCDVCIKNKRKQVTGLNDQIIKELVERLSDGKTRLEPLISALRTGTEEERLKVFRDLLDAGKIKTSGDLYYLD